MASFWQKISDFFKQIFSGGSSGGNTGGGTGGNTGGGSGGTTPPPANTTYPQPPSTDKVRGIMASDMLQMKELKKLRESDLAVLRQHYFNTIYCPIDLAIIHDGQGEGVARPHIAAGRTETAVTDLVCSNIDYLYDQGFRVMVVCGNEPSVRKNWSYLMSGLGFKPNVKVAELYNNQRLENEKKCIEDLLTKRGNKIWGIMLYLEPASSLSVPFVKKLGEYVRKDLSWWKGKVYSGGIEDGRWDGNALQDIRSAPSLYYRNWNTDTKVHLKNADGMAELNASNASTMIPNMTSNLGTDGAILYFDTYRGSKNGPGTLEPWMHDYVKWTGTIPPPNPEVGGKTLTYNVNIQCTDASGIASGIAIGATGVAEMKLTMNKSTYETRNGTVVATIKLISASPAPGASGPMKDLFEQQVSKVIGVPYTTSPTPVTNGSFAIAFENTSIKIDGNGQASEGWSTITSTTTVIPKDATVTAFITRAVLVGNGALVSVDDGSPIPPQEGIKILYDGTVDGNKLVDKTNNNNFATLNNCLIVDGAVQTKGDKNSNSGIFINQEVVRTSGSWSIDMIWTPESMNSQGRLFFQSDRVGGKGIDMLFRAPLKNIPGNLGWALRINNDGATWKQPRIGSISNAGGADHYAYPNRNVTVNLKQRFVMTHNVDTKTVKMYWAATPSGELQIIFDGDYVGKYEAAPGQPLRIGMAPSDATHYREYKMKLYNFKYMLSVYAP